MKALLYEIRVLRTCREVTRLTLVGLDRANTMVDRTAMAVHRLTCPGCRRFKKQAHFMSEVGAAWRAQRDR
jgi:hypothetical protein